MSCCEHRPSGTSSSSIPISPLLLSNQLVVEGRTTRELKPMIQSLILLLHLKRLLKELHTTCLMLCLSGTYLHEFFFEDGSCFIVQPAYHFEFWLILSLFIQNLQKGITGWLVMLDMVATTIFGLNHGKPHFLKEVFM
ncbi:unnamed protein product [Lactuca saligna]|uniref:Uncharacterized protein n=1 Tax=Lactuca saligna TaxID=75948 RepID=A0AA35ZCY3_LACSI|nr:unnamed protein product [Lactuca saligna]